MPTARPFVYDFRRTFLSTTVVAVIVIIVVLSIAIVPSLKSAESSIGIPSSNVGGAAYYDNSTGVNVIVYSFNQFGQPISGTQLNVTAQSGTTTKNDVTSTNSSGYATAVISIPYPSSSVGPTSTNSLTISTPSNGGFSMPFPAASGMATPLFSSVTPVLDTTNSSKVDIAVFYTAPFGAPPRNYGVFYAVNSGFPDSEAGMTRLGVMNDDFQIFSFPPNANFTMADSLTVTIFDASGNPLSSSGFSGSTFLLSGVIQQLSNVQGLVSSFVGGLLVLFVPLMAIVVSYSTYGKDKVSGVLESVLARPVSRRGLSISRFTSTSLAMVAAVVLAMIALDLVVYFLAGFLLTFSFVSSIMASLCVEAIAFVGIMFVLSRVIHSGGALIGVGVGLWAVAVFFWGLIILLIAYLLKYDFGSAGYYNLTVYSSFFDPAQFYGLVSSLTSSSISGFSFTPASYGINVFTVAATGILWIALPFALFLYLAVKKD